MSTFLRPDQLDDFIANESVVKVDFIKMDIEGAERDALLGAKKIIKTMKPKLAVCLYHNIEDYWEIPIQIKRLNPNYRLYFDHHSPIGWESVCYAINQ